MREIKGKNYFLRQEDCIYQLKTLPEDFVDIIITDPPYDLSEKHKQHLQELFTRVSAGAVIVFSPPESPWIRPADQILHWVGPFCTKNTTKNYATNFVTEITIYGRTEWNTDLHWSNYFSPFTDRVDMISLHPHRKPLSLMKRLVQIHTKIGQMVFDPYMGSGTTGEATVSLGRKFTGIEIDKKIFRIAEERIRRADTWRVD